MHRTLSLSLTCCFLIAGITFAQPVVPQGGVVSAASLLPLGAPGYLLSPGGIVSIFGTNLSTSAGVGATFVNGALPTSLGGAQVTIGGVPAPLFYVSSGQINAQVPYTVSVGTAIPVVVTTSVGSSAPSPIPIASAAPGLFSYSQNGMGNAAAQNYVSATSSPANGFTTAIAPGSILIAYGTGGGALTGGPASGAACGGGTFSHIYEARIGLQAASVQYAGCAPGYVGLDQWNIVVPTTVPAGCYLPLQVIVNGVPSNAVTISVADNGNCSSAATGQAELGPGQALGSLELEHVVVSEPSAGINETLSLFTGSFLKNGAVAASAAGGFPPGDAGCYVQVYKSSSSTLSTATTTVTGTTPLDAGVLTLKTPASGSLALSATTIGNYSASNLTGFPAVTPGTYSVSGSGGANVGAFGPVSLTVPALLTVTNPGFTGATISAAQGLNPALTCPDPKGEIVVWALSENSSNIVGSAMCSFSCGSSIVVPSSVLQQMPVSSSGNADLFYIFLPPNNNAGVTSAQFTASGLNLGLLYYADLYLVTGLTLAP